MQIVIDIPNSTFTDLKKKQNRTEVDVAVLNGTPLPKGHGRLIDADELEECKEIMNTTSGESKYAVRMDDIRNATTIIEADKGE